MNIYIDYDYTTSTFSIGVGAHRIDGLTSAQCWRLVNDLREGRRPAPPVERAVAA